MAKTKRSTTVQPVSNAKGDEDWSAGLNSDEFADQLVKRLEAEEHCALKSDDVSAIERFLKTSGVTRRSALLYMARPWKETAQAIAQNHDTAVAFASVAHCLQEDVKRYKTLADLLGRAETRLMVALAVRTDMDEVLSLGKAGVVSHG